MKHIMLHHSDHKGKCYEAHYGHPVLEENDQAPSKRRKWDCTICRLSLTPRGRPMGSTQRDVPRLTLPFIRVKQKRQDKVMRYYKCIRRCRFIFLVISFLILDYEKKMLDRGVIAANTCSHCCHCEILERETAEKERQRDLSN